MRSHVGALRSGLRTLPFRWQLIVLLGGFLLITSIVLAGLAYRTSRQIIEREAIRAVGLVADGREQVLVRILHRHHDRALNFLRAARAFCKTSRPAAACLRRLLEEFQRTERATGARFELPDMPPISVGNPIRTISSLHRERPGRIAWFNVTEAPHYLIAAEAESPRSAVALSFDVGEIHAIFLDRQGLGQTEETFLTDPQGVFITPPQHSSDSGQSHPINA
ncbi:MAG TPA: hypothetical protein VJ692_13415, partial [Nitrospiraceae bacterium]|nr:hypothetical protein [Nitrospiraceae bacterium]